MTKNLEESSSVKGDNSQDYYNKTGKDPVADRREAMSDATYKPNAIKFRRTVQETLDATEELKLDIPRELLHPDYKYAWVAENRTASKERLGWELVPDDHFGKNAGISLKRPASKDSDNFLVLMATPKEWVAAREGKREDERLKVEQGLATGEALPTEFVVQKETKISNSLARKNQA